MAKCFFVHYSAGENIGIFPRRFLDLAAINFYSPIGFWNSYPSTFSEHHLNQFTQPLLYRKNEKKISPPTVFPLPEMIN